MVRATQLVNPVTGALERREDLRENFLLLSQMCNFRPVKVERCAACRVFRKWGDARCECGAELPSGTPTVVWKPVPPAAPAGPQAVVPIVPPPFSPVVPSAPSPPIGVADDEERRNVEHPMERFLTEWDESIEKAERQEEDNGAAPISGASDSDARSEERKWFEATENAYQRGDLVEAADLIMRARKKGWTLPKVDYDED